MGMDLKRTDVQQQVLQLVRDSGLSGISGYQIAVKLEMTSGHVYSTLAKFERAGAMVRLPAAVGTTVGRRAPARPYRLTEVGRAMLEEWINRQ